MNREEDDENIQSNNESGEPDHKISRNENFNIDAAAVVAAGASDQQQSADILKLDVDCFDETFDYLKLKDLMSVGRTCKRLYQVTGQILLQNFAGASAFCSDGSICFGRCYAAERFAEFITKISVDSNRIKYFLNFQSKFQRLKQIEIGHIKLNAGLIHKLNPVLRNVKYLRINWCEIEGCFGDTVLAACPNVTHLYVSNHPCESTIIGSGNNWFLKTYPKLEHFELVLFREPRIPELKTFLELNPNITTFLTFAECLWANRESMLGSNVQLNELAVYVSRDKWESFDSFCNFLNQLHAHGFYQRLNFYYGCWKCKKNLIDQMASLNAVVKLNIVCGEKIALSAFHDIEELNFKASDQLTDLEAIATNLTRLERIHFRKGYVNHISLLIGRAASLSKIVVDRLIDETIGPKRVRRDCCMQQVHDKTVIIQLAELNREREKLADACKITLYVEEEVYLATKWETKETDFNLIRLKRREAYEADNNFNIFGYNRH